MSKPPSSIHDRIARILKKRARCQALGVGTTHHDFDYRYTWFPPPISVVEIERLETYFSVRLPDEYKSYLSQVANGGAGPTFYPLHSLLHALTYGGNLSRPFPLHGTWLRYAAGADPKHVAFCHEEMTRRGFVPEGSPAGAFIYAIPEEANPSDGTLLVGESGCGLDEHLVVDGPHRGEVWHDRNEGAACRAPDFLSFIEDWLDEELVP